MPSLPVTRAALIARAATRANTSGYADATTVDGEVSQLVDLSLAKVHNLLVGLYEDYYTKKHSIALATGQDTYSLPVDFFKVRQLFYVDVPNNGYRWPIQRMDLQDHLGRPLSGSYPNVVYGYILINQNLLIEPRPSGTQTNQLLLYYVPTYTPPDNDATPIEHQIAFGWDEWVVNDVCIQIRLKAMMPYDDIMAERNKIEANIKHQAKQRAVGDPPRVKDTGWNGSGPSSRWGQFAIKG